MAFAGYGSAGYASARLRCGPLRFGHTTQRDGGDQHVRLARVGGIPAGGFGGTLQTVADRIGMYVELLGRGLERTAELQECGDGEQRRIIRACCCQASVDHADQFVTGVRVADQRTFGQGVVGA